MLNYLKSFIYEEDITPDEKQLHLRHLLHKQIVLSNIILKSPECKPSITDGLIDYQLNRLTKASKISVKKKKRKNNILKGHN
jgi:hypothetical protein